MNINLNNERRISVKRLTDADLNRSATSKQTHIGLSDKSLTFMGDRKRASSAILIHKSSWFSEPCDIGKITRREGRHDAPKISMGGRNTENLVSRIRKIASTNSHTHYLLWFASDTGTPIFWLIRKGSNDFKKLKEKINISSIGSKIETFDPYDAEYEALVELIREV